MPMAQGKKWQEENDTLQAILAELPLTEERKWGKPVYTLDGKNVVFIIRLKDFCALSFFKGALLKDPKYLLEKIGDNTQSGRWIKFTSVKEIEKLKPALKSYVREAIEVEKAGLKVELKKTSEYAVPEEFQNKLNKTPALKKAYNALTPGRQRGYLLYFAGAKQSKTRAARVEKCVPQILAGRGLND